MLWTAQIIAEGSIENESSGETPDDAVLNMLAEIMQQWKRGEASVCGDYIKELGEAIIELERHDEDSEFESQCGDFVQPWKLVVKRTPCDQLGNGCTCEECTAQIADAAGIVYDGSPLDPDHEFTDDCEQI